MELETATSLPEDRELVVRYISSRDVPCPKCRYNLRSVATNICPECGALVRLEIATGTAGSWYLVALIIAAGAGLYSALSAAAYAVLLFRSGSMGADVHLSAWYRTLQALLFTTVAAMMPVARRYHWTTRQILMIAVAAGVVWALSVCWLIVRELRIIAP
jgi:hypothetical protein